MSNVLIVAGKELRDLLTGKRFLIILGIIILVTILGMVSGMQNYDSQLKQYKEQLASNQQSITQMQQQIADMEARGESPENIQSMRDQVESMLNPYMPSSINVMSQIGWPLTMAGALLAIIMGFDMITREREEGSLKQLLTRPMFRDNVINGKALAGILAIAVMIGITFLIALAILLIYGIVPAGDDLTRIVAFYVVTVLYVISFFAISMLVSTVVKSSTMAILCMLGLFLIFNMLGTVSYQISSVAMGPRPEYPNMNSYYPMTFDANYTGPTQAQMEEINQIQWKYQNDSMAYEKKSQQIRDLTALLSPNDNYNSLTSVITNKEKPWDPAEMYSSGFRYTGYKPLTLMQTLPYKWTSLLVMLVEIVAALGLSYMFFMRSDVT